MCGTPVQAISDIKNLTGLAGGGRGRSKYAPEFEDSQTLDHIRKTKLFTQSVFLPR